MKKKKHIRPKPRTRPDWDSFYLAQAFIASSRSIDPNTQHGCIIVSKDNRILSSACNGPLRGVDDDKIPMNRPDKYSFIIHAEENAIIFYSGSNKDIEGGTAYVTGRPCHKCLRMLMQKGISRVVYSDMETVCVDSHDLMIQESFLDLKNDKNFSMELYPYKSKIKSVIEDRLSYLIERVKDE